MTTEQEAEILAGKMLPLIEPIIEGQPTSAVIQAMTGILIGLLVKVSENGRAGAVDYLHAIADGLSDMPDES